MDEFIQFFLLFLLFICRKKRGNVNDYGSTSLLMSTSGNDFFQTIAPLFFKKKNVRVSHFLEISIISQVYFKSRAKSRHRYFPTFCWLALPSVGKMANRVTRDIFFNFYLSNKLIILVLKFSFDFDFLFNEIK